MDWATRLSLRAPVLSVRTLAMASAGFKRRDLACFPMTLDLGPLGLLVGGVAVEGAGRRELAELHAHHVLADQHRHMLLAVVHPEGQADELGHDGRAAR